MKNRTRLFGIYLPFFILLTLVAITLKTVATVGFFEYNYHFFTNKPLPIIANSLMAAAILFFIIYIIVACKEIKLIPSFSSPANYVPSAIISASLIFMIMHLLNEFFYEPKFSIHGKIVITTWLALILAIFAALSIAYFALNTIFIRTVSIRRANFGLCAIIFLGLYLAYLYFDTSAPINSQIKISDQLAYAFAAVFFLYEIRLSLGREKWKSYIIFGFIAAALSAYSSIPALITYFATKRVISNSIYESILTFSIFLFVVLKLALINRLIEKKEDAFVEKLKEAAKKRETELNPITTENEEPIPEEEQIEEPDENQISILDTKTEEEESFNPELYEESGIPMNISSEDYH